MELYGGAAVAGDAGQEAECEDCFASFGQAMLTLYQILCLAGWSDVMFSTMTRAGSFFGCAAYFISFALVNSVVLMNVLAALVLEIYAMEIQKHDEHVRDKEKQERDVGWAVDEVAEDHKSIARLQVRAAAALPARPPA